MADPAEIERRLASLRETYGEFPVESGTYEHPPERFERVLANHERGSPGAARVWVEREGETLLVRTRDRPDAWGVPGGLVEPGEGSDEAGEREIREETGVECEVVDVAYAHVAEYVGGELTVEGGEILEARWWGKVPENSYPPASRLQDRL